MGKHVVLKLPIGSSPPSADYKFIRTIRGMNIYNKEVIEITKDVVDELSGMFDAVQIIDSSSCGIDGLIDKLEKECIIRGGYQKKTRRRKVTRKRSVTKRNRKHRITYRRRM